MFIFFRANVPRTICFGAGSQRGFLGRGRRGVGRHWHQTQGHKSQTARQVKDVNMEELTHALDQT